MNFRNEKMVKAVVILFGILCAVLLLRFFIQKNSYTLSDYAAQDPSRNQPVEQVTDTIGTSDEVSVDSLEETDKASVEASDATEETPVGSSGETEKASVDSIDGTEKASDKINAVEETVVDERETAPLIGKSLNADTMIEDRTVYAENFYYEPLSPQLIKFITGISYPELAEGQSAAIGYDDLRYLHILYVNFDGDFTEGELICNKAIAADLAEIFHTLYENEYQLEKVRLIDEYQGDDTASMTDNNTSCFNYRNVEDSGNLSMHAYGRAIDVNPFYNPYVTYPGGKQRISPEGSEEYADRSKDFPYKINEYDLCYQLFKEHGFTWGGNWNSLKDYQHFQKK